VEMLADAKIPTELSDNTVRMTEILVNCAQVLRGSIEKLSLNTPDAVEDAKRVNEIEHEIDVIYLKTKGLFVKYGGELNSGAMVIFDDLVEFIEQAADMCADTADYIVILASRE
jgi:uncharacterized protein Yka (UPF0111/DUF47 family)